MGPGDVIFFEVIGLPEFTGNLSIGPDGFLYLPEIININNKILNRIPKYDGSDISPWVLGIFRPSNGIILNLLLENISSSRGKKLIKGLENTTPQIISKITVAKTSFNKISIVPR